MTGTQPDAARLRAYLAFAKAHPELFSNPDRGGFSILLNEVEIREAEAQQANRLKANGGSADWAQVGIAFEDQYLILLRDAVRFPDGSRGTYIRLLSSNPRVLGVAILPVYEGKVLLIRHFRHATRTWHVEIPRGFGTVSNSQASAREELWEEIRATFAGLIDLGEVYPNTGISSERVALFYAQIAEYGQPEADEAIAEIVPTPIPEFERMIGDGEVTDGFALATYARAKARGLLS